MERSLRVMVASVGLTGHFLPVLALARAVRERGHEVLLETSERWRAVVEDLGIGFAQAAEPIAPPGSSNETGGPTLASAARSLAPVLTEFRPEVVVSDLFTLAPALAAEVAGVPRASLIHHPYPISEPGWPPFPSGLRLPRTPFGAAAWRILRPPLDPRLRKGRAQLNRTRAELGLPPLDRYFGAISDGLALVATFPQLEYPRRWPAHVHVTGPMLLDLPHPEIELPPGEAPLVVVAASSAQDRELTLVRTALEALESEPVRVLATTSDAEVSWREAMPGNAAVVPWAPFSQVLPQASLVITSGGHGTVARALADGVPLLVCPAGADQPENGRRVAWAGAGLVLSRRLLGPGRLRGTAKRLLTDESFTRRAKEIAAWSRDNDGSDHAAELVERYASR